MARGQVSTSSYAYGDIIEASCVVKKRPNTYRSIFIPTRIFKKCGIPNTRVLVTDGVSIEAKAPLAVLSWPVVLLRSALEPLAVFSMPVTFSKSAFVPTAVLLLPVVLKKALSHRWPCWTARCVAQKGFGACGRIVVSGVVKKRPSANGGIGDACPVVKERSITSGRVESAKAQI